MAAMSDEDLATLTPVEFVRGLKQTVLFQEVEYRLVIGEYETIPVPDLYLEFLDEEEEGGWNAQVPMPIDAEKARAIAAGLVAWADSQVEAIEARVKLTTEPQTIWESDDYGVPRRIVASIEDGTLQLLNHGPLDEGKDGAPFRIHSIEDAIAVRETIDAYVFNRRGYIQSCKALSRGAPSPNRFDSVEVSGLVEPIEGIADGPK
jgi:hypothetical protein